MNHSHLEVDPDAVRALAGTLAGIADGVAGLKLPAPAVLPESIVAGASEAALSAVIDAYHDIAGRIRSMSATASANATAFADADAEFRDQLRRYQAGLP